MKAVVAVALVFRSGVVLVDAGDDCFFSLLLGGEGYYCCCSPSNSRSTARGKIISSRTVVLGKVHMAIDPTRCDVAASCVDDLGIFTSGKKHPQTGYFAILYTDFDARREHLTCRDLSKF